MKINGKTIEQNQHMTYSEQQYIKARTESLAEQLERKGYDVSIDHSRVSEAAYITINDNKVNFRNHDHFNDNLNDYTVWLSRFDTWTEAKNYFMNEILPQIEAIEEEIAPTKDEVVVALKKRIAEEKSESIRKGYEAQLEAYLGGGK